MKRPQGFDRAAAPTAAPQRRGIARQPAALPQRPTAQARAATPTRTAGQPRAAAKQRAAEARRFTRHAREVRRMWLIGSGIAVLVVATLLVAIFSPLLSLRTIQVTGTEHLKPADIEQAVSDQLGTPLALLDTDRITQQLQRFPTIQSYTTEIVPPDTLVIAITERSPIGAVQTATGFDTVDAAGVTLSTSTTRPDKLPLIAVDANGVTGAGFAASTAVLRALRASMIAKVDTVTATTEDDVTFTMRGSQQKVLWGSDADSARKAQVLAVLMGRYADKGAGVYDVSGSESASFRAAAGAQG